MIVTQERMMQRKQLATKNMLLNLSENTFERYHLNILIIINILNHIYIESELYQLEYGRAQNFQLQEDF